MAQCNALNIKLSNSQLNKLKSGIKNGTQITLNLSSNVVGDSNNETNFPHKLLLIDTQVSRLHKAFGSGPSANTTFSHAQLSKIGQSGGLSNRLLGPLLKAGLPLMENVLKPLAENVLIPLRLTTAA